MSVEDPGNVLGLEGVRALEEQITGLSVLVEAGEAECDVILTTDVRLRELNRVYRNVDAPTDVLAFSLELGFAHEGKSLGEVYVSVDRARIQAGERGCEVSEEIAHLALHGFLHLLGYDHPGETDLGVMEALVARVLSPGAPQAER